MAVWVSTRPSVQSQLIDSTKQEVHITLAFIQGVSFSSVFDTVSYWWDCSRYSDWNFPIAANITGMATWIVPHKYVKVALVETESNTLHRMREDLVAFLNIDTPCVDSTYPFTPHVTLRESTQPFHYVPLLREKIPFTIDNLYVSEGDKHTRIV